MSIHIATADFKRAISIATKVTGKRSTLPILSTVRCRANGKFEAVGTDLDTQISASVPRQPGSDAEFALMSPREVLAAVSGAGGDAITLNYSDGKASLDTGPLSLDVSTLPYDDFPTDLDRELHSSFSATLSAAHLKEIGRVASSISTEETRYYLNGVNLKCVGDNKYRAASTDGHRLCFVDLDLPDASGDIGDIIIHRDMLNLMRDLGGKSKAGISIRVGTTAAPNQDSTLAPSRPSARLIDMGLEVQGVEVRIRSKLIDGTYPDYARVIPPANDKQILFAVQDLRRALRGISGFSKHARACKIELSGSKARISAAYVDIGLSASVEIACQHNADGLIFGLNGNYLMAMLDASGGDEILFTALDPAAPVLVQNPAGTNWTGVIMPMRV